MKKHSDFIIEWLQEYHPRQLFLANETEIMARILNGWLFQIHGLF